MPLPCGAARPAARATRTSATTWTSSASTPPGPCSLLERAGRAWCAAARGPAARPRRARRAGRGRRARRTPARRAAGEQRGRGRRGPVGVLIATVARTPRRARSSSSSRTRSAAQVAAGLGIEAVDPRRPTWSLGQRLDRRRGRRHRLRGVRRRGRRSPRRRRPRHPRPAGHGGDPPPAPRGRPAPLLLARAGAARRPALPARRHRRRSELVATARSRPQLITRVEPLERARRGLRRRWSGGGVMKVLHRLCGRATMTALFDLTGRTAVVTGARRGIGLAMAEALAAAGADIIGVCAQLERQGSEVERAGARPPAAGSRRCGRDFADRGGRRGLAARHRRARRRSTSWSTTPAPSPAPRPPSTRTRCGTTSWRSNLTQPVHPEPGDRPGDGRARPAGRSSSPRRC